MAQKGDWWTCPTESESGKLIMVTGRRDIEAFRRNPKFNIRVEVTWKYEADASGMPDVQTSELMEKVNDQLEATFDKDPVAVLTGIYTGDGERNWVFYTHTFLAASSTQPWRNFPCSPSQSTAKTTPIGTNTPR
jgi:hypothetical protein